MAGLSTLLLTDGHKSLQIIPPMILLQGYLTFCPLFPALCGGIGCEDSGFEHLAAGVGVGAGVLAVEACTTCLFLEEVSCLL